MKSLKSKKLIAFFKEEMIEIRIIEEYKQKQDRMNYCSSTSLTVLNDWHYTDLSFSSICLRRARTCDFVSTSRAWRADTELELERGVLVFFWLLFEDVEMSWQNLFISFSSSK